MCPHSQTSTVNSFLEWLSRWKSIWSLALGCILPKAHPCWFPKWTAYWVSNVRWCLNWESMSLEEHPRLCKALSHFFSTESSSGKRSLLVWVSLGRRRKCSERKVDAPCWNWPQTSKPVKWCLVSKSFLRNQLSVTTRMSGYFTQKIGNRLTQSDPPSRCVWASLSLPHFPTLVWVNPQQLQTTSEDNLLELKLQVGSCKCILLPTSSNHISY